HAIGTHLGEARVFGPREGMGDSMGTGTKIGIVLIMVLVVVVIANLLDSEVQNGPTAEEQVTGISNRDPAIRPSSNRRTISNSTSNSSAVTARGSESKGGQSSAANQNGSARRSASVRPVTPSARVAQQDQTAPSIGPKDAPLMNTTVGGSQVEPAVARTDQFEVTPAAGVIRNNGGIEPVVTTRTHRLQQPAVVPGSVSQRVGPLSQIKVIEGDSLWRIASRELGAGIRWTELLPVNPGLTETTTLIPGRLLTIPRSDSATAMKEPVTMRVPAEATRSGMRQVQIRDGDTLYDIARDELGNGGRWLEIQKLNDGLNPNALPIGKKIWIPR
ncbi:MAG: LysM domain-containing protein, partial [bacterium]